MNAAERRRQIEQLLRRSDRPVSATAIAARFSVSRQVIVGDIALLRAGGLAITATPRGYILEPPEEGAPVGWERTLACCHDNDRLQEELYTIVDLGGTVVDVTVSHSIYGQICAPLHIGSRFDADEFCQKASAAGARPLCDLTDGVHLHRIRAASEEALDRIEKALREKSLLLPRE